MSQKKLTPKTYFSKKNTALSNSKINDFLKSKNYFYRKHILHTVTRKNTPNMKIGSTVDAIVSGTTPEYTCKVLKRDNPELFEEQKGMDPDFFITESQMEEALAHAQNIMKTPAYKWYKKNKAKFQVVLQGEYTTESGNVLPLCGMADVIVSSIKGTVYIDDFKVVSYMKLTTPDKWKFNCYDFGYFRQLAFYAYLYKQSTKDQRNIVCRHMVSTKVDEDLYKVYLFTIGDDILEQAFEEIEQSLEKIDKVIESNDWDDDPVLWDTAHAIV